MSRSRELWYGDGTFKSSPTIAAQLYTIHYQRHENTLPGVFAIMENRHQESYVVLFQALKNLLPRGRNSGPRMFSTDFELASSNAFGSVFLDSRPAFCFFHFSQSLWRKAQETGLAAAYGREENVEIRSQFHACLALAFAPVRRVPHAFTLLRDNAVEELDGVLDLLEDTYVLGRRRGRGRRAPRFPVDTWNVYERTLEGEARTNNSVEGWNRPTEQHRRKESSQHICPHGGAPARRGLTNAQRDYNRSGSTDPAKTKKIHRKRPTPSDSSIKV